MKNYLKYLDGLINTFREEKEHLEKMGDIKNDAYYMSVKDQLFLTECIRMQYMNSLKEELIKLENKK